MHNKHRGHAQRAFNEALLKKGDFGGLEIPEAASLVLSLGNASACQRGHVGCALYDYGGKLVACGWNDNVPNPGCDHPEVQGGCGCLHAEMRALVSGREKGSGTPYVAVISRAPCEPCSKALIWAGVRRLIFIEESWPWPEAVKIWDGMALIWHQFTLTDTPA